MFRMNGMPRAQGCAGAASSQLAQHMRTNGYVQDERYAAGAGMRRSGVFPVGTALKDERLSRRVGNLLPTRFTALESKRCVTSYAPYDYCALRSCQFCTAFKEERFSRRVGNLLPTRFTSLESKRCVTSYAPYE